MRIAHATVDEYIAAQPAPARRVLEKVRAIIRKALRGASESISYQIPTYKVDGEMVCYFAGHREHYALYPVTPRASHEIGAELSAAKHGKGTVRFAYDKPIPTKLITRFVRVRAAEAADYGLARAAKKSAKRTRPAAKKKGASARVKRPAAKANKSAAKKRSR